MGTICDILIPLEALMISSRSIHSPRPSLRQAIEIRLCGEGNIRRRKSLIMRKGIISNKNTREFPLEKIAEYKRELVLVEEGSLFFSRNLDRLLGFTQPEASICPEAVMNDEEPKLVETKIHVTVERSTPEMCLTSLKNTSCVTKRDKLLKPIDSTHNETLRSKEFRGSRVSNLKDSSMDTSSSGINRHLYRSKLSINFTPNMSSMVSFREKPILQPELSFETQENSNLLKEKSFNESVLIALTELPHTDPIPVKTKPLKHKQVLEPLKKHGIR